MPTTLRLEPVVTETTPGEFVTDGYQVVPVVDGVDQVPVARSRFANKAAIKALLLTATGPFAGATVEPLSAAVAAEVGKQNLELLIAHDKFVAIKALSAAEVPVDELVAFRQAKVGEEVEAVQTALSQADTPEI